MDNLPKKDENNDRRDRPAVRFETVVEPTEVTEVPVEQPKLELPHRIPPEMPREQESTINQATPVQAEDKSNPNSTTTEESVVERAQGTRFDELARALGDGGVEAETKLSNKKTGGRTFGWGWLAFVLIFIFGAGLGIAGGYVMWGKQFEIGNLTGSGEDLPLFSETSPKAAVPTVRISPTAGATIDRAAIALQILNGGGVPGAASELKEQLEDLGYKGINAGNANRSDYQETKVSIKESKKSLLQMILADIGKQISVSTATSTLSETSSFDAIVTIGKPAN